MQKNPILNSAHLERLDAVGAHFKFIEMQEKLNIVIQSGA